MRKKNNMSISKDYIVKTFMFLFLFLLLFVFLCLENVVNAKFNRNHPEIYQSKKEIKILEQGKPIERQLAGGESHSYQIFLDEGQFLHLMVEQKGIDVVVVVISPDSQMIAEVDSPTGTQGSEIKKIIIQTSGNYQIEVYPLEKKASRGTYEIKIQELRQATSADSIRVAAEMAFTDGEKLGYQGNSLALEEAIEKYRNALQLWQALGDTFEMGNVISNIGKIYNKLGDYQSALSSFNNLLKFKKEINDEAGQAAVFCDLAEIYDNIGKVNNALESYNNALELRRKLNDQKAEAKILYNMGDLFHNRGESQKSFTYLDQALKLAKELKEVTLEIDILNSIGIKYENLQEPHKALRYYKEAQQLLKLVGNKNKEARLLNSIAVTIEQLGERQKALEYYNRSLQITREIENRKGEAIILGNIGDTYNQFNQFDKALLYYEESLNISKLMGYKNNEARMLNGIAYLHTKFEKNLKALEYYKNSIRIFQSLGNLQGEATALSNISLLYNKLDSTEKALDCLNKSLLIRKKIHDRIGEAYVLCNIGSLYFKRLNDIQNAFNFYKQALEIVKNVGDPFLESKIYHNLCHIEYNIGNYLKAKHYAELTINCVESIRLSVASRSLRTSYFSSIREYYENLLNILEKLSKKYPSEGYDMMAFQESERARSRSFLELLMEGNIEIRSGVDIGLVNQEQSIQQQLNEKEQSRLNLENLENNEQQIVVVEKEISELLAELEEVQTQIRLANPHYAQLSNPKPLSVKEIREKVLDENTVLLEYTLSQNFSFLWTLTMTDIKGYKLSKRDDIETAARRVYELLTSRNQNIPDENKKDKRQRNARADTELIQAKHELSQKILAPLGEELNKKRLLIVCEGVLQYIPFGILPRPDTLKESNQVPLVADHEIVYLPSASIMPLLREEVKHRKQTDQVVAILADPVLSIDDSRLKRSTPLAFHDKSSSTDSEDTDIEEIRFVRSIQESGFGETRSDLSRLPFSRQEAIGISSLVPREKRMCALDFDASYATATSPELNNYRIIHFATHGLLNSIHPELSGLVLSLVDQEGKPQNGFLRLHDIFNLNLNADLVVLSACQTALGKDVKGEGLIGLTRGFMYAGVPRVVASLWKVDDEATAELMKRFYQFMLGAEQLPAAAALRKAQISIMNEKRWQSPYYWAGFVLQGDWR